MNEDSKTQDLGSIPGDKQGGKPSNTNPIEGTTSQPNALKKNVSVGRKPETKNVPIGGTKNG